MKLQFYKRKEAQMQLSCNSGSDNFPLSCHRELFRESPVHSSQVSARYLVRDSYYAACSNWEDMGKQQYTNSTYVLST